MARLRASEKSTADEKRKLPEIEKQKELEFQMKNENKLKEEFINMLKSKYQFDGFHHYTDFANVHNIMEIGKLLCRNSVQEFDFHDAAEQSIINKTREDVKNCVRFYYKENTPTLYSNEGIIVDNINNRKAHMPIPVLLLFSENIINHGNIAFTSGNAGSINSQLENNIRKAMDFDWKTIFSRGPIPTDVDSVVAFGCDKNKKDVVNKRNAEFLVNHKIDIKHIKKIIFRCPADLKHALIVLGKNGLYEVNNQKFNNQNNYLYDYNIVKKLNSFNFNLIFNPEQNIYSHDKYSHELRITYNDGFLETKNITTPNNRIIKKHASNNIYCFDFIPVVNRIVIIIEYFMDGHLSALWRNAEYDYI